MLPDKRLVIWQLALSCLDSDIGVVLLYVVESIGSSPGRSGFFMVVAETGELAGSIGGGIMEHKFIEMSKLRLRQKEQTSLVRRQIHDKAAAKDQSGMICSGEQTIVVYSLKKEDAMPIRQLVAGLGVGEAGCFSLSPTGPGYERGVPGSDFSWEAGEDWRYKERTGYRDRLYIIGGGHCALALSRVMRTMDFYITLFEEREELDTFIRNEFVHEKIVIASYSELGRCIDGDGQHDYVMVMTQGYRTDDVAVRALMEKEPRYFGLLGSKAKIDKMYADYLLEGIDEERLKRLRAPAGLVIRSQTPEEIAISIAAEIIQVRNIIS